MTEEPRVEVISDLDVYAKALKHVQSIYERQVLNEGLEHCKGCHLMKEVLKLCEHVEASLFEEIEKDLGYHFQ